MKVPADALRTRPVTVARSLGQATTVRQTPRGWDPRSADHHCFLPPIQAPGTERSSFRLTAAQPLEARPAGAPTCGSAPVQTLVQWKSRCMRLAQLATCQRDAQCPDLEFQYRQGLHTALPKGNTTGPGGPFLLPDDQAPNCCSAT